MSRLLGHWGTMPVAGIVPAIVAFLTVNPPCNGTAALVCGMVGLMVGGNIQLYFSWREMNRLWDESDRKWDAVLRRVNKNKII